MKKKKKVIFAITLVLFLLMQLSPGCIMIGLHDDFDYIISSERASGEFMPDLYIRDNTQNIHVLLLRIDIDRLPHSFVMSQYDHSYLEKSKGFNSFVLEYLYIQFEDGTRIDCVDPSLPQAERTFKISSRWEKVFQGVIKERMDFTVHTEGFAIKKDGSVAPFKRTEQYKYKRKLKFHTIIHEIASC